MESSRLIRIAVTAVIAAGVTALIVRQFDPPGYDVSSSGPMGGMAGMEDGVAKPDLDGLALEGHEVFKSNCSSCHGGWAGGTDKGPSLIQKTYESAHHSDMAIVLAMRNGVRQHHRRFGSMPPQPQIKFEDAQKIIAFIRTVQAANGIR